MGTCQCIRSDLQTMTEIRTSNPKRKELMLLIRENPRVLKNIIQIQARWKGLIVRDMVKVRRGNNQSKCKSEIFESMNIGVNTQEKNSQERLKAIKENNELYKKIPEEEFAQVSTLYKSWNDGVEVSLLPPLEYANKAVYYGEWSKDNKRHGRGIQWWADGSKFQGYWVNDKANLKGKLIHCNGDYYEGDWVNDKAEGFGKYYHLNGASYEGYWKEDKQEGRGLEIWPDGARYEGYYVNGFKSGEGKFQWADGTVYTGSFENNNICGKGVYVWRDERIYEGEWLNNKMHGKGIFKWPDGRKYEGDYWDYKKHGYGVFEWPDGRKYKGSWKNGKQDGEGEFFNPKTNEWCKGFWISGKRNKKEGNSMKTENEE